MHDTSRKKTTNNLRLIKYNLRNKSSNVKQKESGHTSKHASLLLARSFNLDEKMKQKHNEKVKTTLRGIK